MYATFQFFFVDEKGCVYTAQPTLINNYELVGPQMDLLCKKIILRLLTDLEIILLDRSRGGNQTSY